MFVKAESSILAERFSSPGENVKFNADFIVSFLHLVELEYKVRSQPDLFPLSHHFVTMTEPSVKKLCLSFCGKKGLAVHSQYDEVEK